MKALTVRQPWAWAITRGHKPVENRTWTTDYRGPIAIHAGQRWDDDGIDALREIARTVKGQDGWLPKTLAEDAPYSNTGMVLATATLSGICAATVSGTWQCTCGPWAVPGQHHWQLTDVRALPEPFQQKGRLGLWELGALE